MPIKRAKELQQLSREHHYGLLLCWKIRAGIKLNIEAERIKTYVNWFFTEHLEAHFIQEEHDVFPILGYDHPIIKKAMEQHQKIRRLITSEHDLYKCMGLLEEELESHIRFEERVLFNAVQEIANSDQLSRISALHNEGKFEDNIQDPFWELK